MRKIVNIRAELQGVDFIGDVMLKRDVANAIQAVLRVHTYPRAPVVVVFNVDVSDGGD